MESYVYSSAEESDCLSGSPVGLQSLSIASAFQETDEMQDEFCCDMPHPRVCDATDPRCRREHPTCREGSPARPDRPSSPYPPENPSSITNGSSRVLYARSPKPKESKESSSRSPRASFSESREPTKSPRSSFSESREASKSPRASFSEPKESPPRSPRGSITQYKSSSVFQGNENDPSSSENADKKKGTDGSYDPSCNPDHPTRVNFEEITSAAYRIKSGIVNTPCERSHISSLTGMDIYLKKDFLQHTGSFKERGARYAMLMLSPEKRQKGVIAASLGNHAQAVSYHGQLLGIPVTVVMPIIAPIMKIQKCREYGANVIMEGKDMGEAKKIAIKLSQERDLTYINGYDHPQIIAGQGTIGLEILEQVDNVDAIVVPTGGGGLLAGVGVAVKTLNPKVKLIGVESERCASFSRAMEAGMPVFTPIEGTLADGLAVPMVGYNAWETAKSLIDKIVVVKEEWIAVAILRLVELEKCIVEGAGAAGLAAILEGQLDEFKGKRVVLILSGGNIDTTILGRCLERGLAADGRLVKCKVTVSDRPGGISELCKLIGSIGVSIKDVIHERAWVASDVFSVEVKVVCETRDAAHTLQLRDLLFSRYKKVKFDNLPNNTVVSTTESSN